MTKEVIDSWDVTNYTTGQLPFLQVLIELKDHKMKKIITALSVISLLAFFACSSTQSLQEYYVDNSENPNFISLDVPTSNVSLTADIGEVLEKVVTVAQEESVEMASTGAKNVYNNLKSDIHIPNVSIILNAPEDRSEFQGGGHSGGYMS